MADKDPGYSPFIQAVAGDGTSPPDVRVLSGWLGASGEEGFVRLYLDSSLSTYVDIPKDAILYSEEIPSSHPAGQRTVWVKSDAELKEGGSAITRAAKFLFGQVQQDFLGGGAQPAPGGEASAPGARPEAAAAAQPQALATPLCLTYRPGCERTGITGDCQSNLQPCITQTEMPPRCGFTRIPCSAIDACPTRLCPQQYGQQQFGAPVTALCPRTNLCPRPTLIRCQQSQFIQCQQTAIGCATAGACPSAVDACPSSLGCTFACNVDFTIFQQTPVLQQRQPQNFAVPQFDAQQQFAQQQFGAPATWICPAPTRVNCITTHNCATRFVCPTLGGCPSAVDACPSSLGCTFACNVDFTVFQQTPVLQQTPVFQQPQFDANVFGGGFVGAGPNVPITQTPSALCITNNCQTPILACPNPSTVKACSTAVPALCPNQPLQPRAAECVGQTFQTGASCPCSPQAAVASGPGWTCYCPPQHTIYPQCPTGHTGCVTYPCWDFAAAQNCVGQTFQTGHTCPCPPATGQQCVPPATQQNCPPPSPPPKCCVGQTFQTGHSCPCPQAFGEQSTEFCPTSGGCGGQAIGHTAPGWCGGGGGQHTGHPCITGGPCTGFAQNAGWTSLGCNPQTHYPQCNSSVGVCATRPPCF